MRRTMLQKRLTSALSGSLHTRGLMLWVATLVTGILCVSQHVYSTKLAEDIQTLRDDRKALEAEIGFLRIERARLTSRERVEQYAAQRLGMRYPKAHEVIRIGEGTGVPRRTFGDDLVEGEHGAVNNG